MCTCTFCSNPTAVNDSTVKRAACFLCGAVHIIKKSQRNGDFGAMCTKCFIASTPCPDCNKRYIGVPSCGCTVKCTIGSHYVKKGEIAVKGICQACLQVPEIEKENLVAMIGQEPILAGRAAVHEKIAPPDNINPDGIVQERLVSANVRDYMVRNIARALDIQGPDGIYLYGITDDHEVDLFVCNCCNNELVNAGYNSQASGAIAHNVHRVGISRELRLDDARRARLIQDLNTIFRTRQVIRQLPRQRGPRLRHGINIQIPPGIMPIPVIPLVEER